MTTDREVMLKALKSIAEGNLGNDPWQANYEKIRKVAADAIDAAEAAETPSQRFSKALTELPKLAAAADCHVGIRVTAAQAQTKDTRKK